MSNNLPESGPAGSAEASAVELGQPTEPTAGGADREVGERPDLDARQRHISTTRKPMGPPQPRVEPGDEQDTRSITNQEPPSDPELSGR
jgi:hypothetical protein